MFISKKKYCAIIERISRLESESTVMSFECGKVNLRRLVMLLEDADVIPPKKAQRERTIPLAVDRKKIAELTITQGSVSPLTLDEAIKRIQRAICDKQEVRNDETQR